eukprot:GILJ01003706.1.p1 GENE.GILJ01003706.1~~GILJ01003706.1.p1  ORF type:complete len:306 (+),score=34.41 GILJ01003706.1:55-972(+)
MSEANTTSMTTEQEPRMLKMRWCHQCRAKRVGVQCCKKFVLANAGFRECRKAFCESCLTKFYGECMYIAVQNPGWICPFCNDACVCTHCVATVQQLMEEAHDLEPTIQTVQRRWLGRHKKLRNLAKRVERYMREASDSVAALYSSDEDNDGNYSMFLKTSVRKVERELAIFKRLVQDAPKPRGSPDDHAVLHIGPQPSYMESADSTADELKNSQTPERRKKQRTTTTTTNNKRAVKKPRIQDEGEKKKRGPKRQAVSSVSFNKHTAEDMQTLSESGMVMTTNEPSTPNKARSAAVVLAIRSLINP